MSAIGQTHGIDFKSALEDGNEDLAAGFWWVKRDGAMLVAEWKQDWVMGRKQKQWSWHFTDMSVCSPAAVEPIEMIVPPRR